MAIGEPFVLDGTAPGAGETAALLIHGFTGTPYEMRYLGERLAASGVTAIAPRLPGHGTTVADLARTTWRDWTCAVERELDASRARYARVALVGQSLGALLALELASRRRDVVAVCALAAPLWLTGLGARVARWTAPGHALACIRTLPKLGGSDVRDPRRQARQPGLSRVPDARARRARRVHARRGCRVARDRGAGARAARRGRSHRAVRVLRAHRRACAARGLVPFARSYHLLATDVERDAVAAAVIDFVKENACATS